MEKEQPKQIRRNVAQHYAGLKKVKFIMPIIQSKITRLKKK